MSKHARPETPSDPLKHPSTKRAKQVDTEDNPYDQLVDLNEADNKAGPAPTTVLHWFRNGDLRAVDNRGLAAAATKARDGNVALIACYLFSPAEMLWHGTSAARADFLRESIVDLQRELKEQGVPLVPIVAEKREDKIPSLTEFVKKHNVNHIFANYEYEVDELRRDVDLFQHLAKEENTVVFELHHDQTIMEPQKITNSNGGPHKVFTPYHAAWLEELATDPSLIDTVEEMRGNEQTVADKVTKLFDQKIPDIPGALHFEKESERKRLRKLWPAGHQAARDRLNHFLQKKVANYAKYRSNPAKDISSRLSPYFATGILSVREALSAAKKANEDSVDFTDSINPGIAAWVREIVFREFYRHMMTLQPHSAMNLPKNLKFDFVEWEEDEEGWKKWCEGTTGMPFVDAGMRQLASEAYMHNRLRMNVASYLRTNLLIDYRRGERYFAENLVDWDLCNNTNGWEPSWTVFNPVSQAERNDPDGDYIRKWVPELKEVEGKAIFDPYNRLDKKAFEKLDYPAPHVDWHKSKERCMQRYKHDMQDAEP